MSDQVRMRRLAGLLLALAVVMVAAGWSRIWPPALLLRPCADVMRWRELLSMVVFAPVLAVLLWLLFAEVAEQRLDGWAAGFLAGVYFMGCGMGMHDPCNLMGSAYRGLPGPLRESLRFFDDDLGHWVFWLGFVSCSILAGVQQVRHPLAAPMSRTARVLFLLLGLPIAFVMLTNLVWEDTRRDLVVIAVAALVTGGVHAVRRVPMGRTPLLWVLYPHYAAAVIGSLVYWLATGGPGH